jgi:hypothetical protein
MADFIVTTLNDEVSGGGTLAQETADGAGLSLREALALANGNPGQDNIKFASSLTGGKLMLTQGGLVITDAVSIDGDSNNDDLRDITIDGNHASRIFFVLSGDLTLEDLTLQNGRATGGAGGNAGGGGMGAGGAVFVNAGTATILDVAFSANTATGGAGGGVGGYYTGGGGGGGLGGSGGFGA